MNDRERVMNMLCGCPGCLVPYGVEFQLYNDENPEKRSREYLRYLNCRVCSGDQCDYLEEDKFILRPPK